MSSKLNCYQLSIECYKLCYISIMVTRTEKPVIDTQKESNQIATKHHQITEEDSKRGCKGKKSAKQSENNKMTIITPYLSVITLKINRLNPPNRRHRMLKWMKNNIQQYAS